MTESMPRPPEREVRVERDEHGRWLPGTPSPGTGRKPRNWLGLADALAENGLGADVIARKLQEIVCPPDGVKVATKDRLEALNIASRYQFAQPPAELALNVSGSVSTFSLADVLAAQLLMRAERAAIGAGAGVVVEGEVRGLGDGSDVEGSFEIGQTEAQMDTFELD